MCNILLPVINIHPRTQEISKILTPLRDKKIPCRRVPGKFDGAIVVAAHDGNIDGRDYRQLHFRSINREIYCQYFEIWKPKNDEELILLKAYLTLFQFKRDTRDLEEFICIHCDPTETYNNRISKYKRGPHLHVVKSQEPLPKCHFPLNLGHLDEVLSSVDSLSKAMGDAVQVLRDEVINRS